MLATEKISVAMGREELRLARIAAQQEGMSLSAFVTRAVRDLLAERRRMEATREVLATFEADELPTAEETQELMALWSAPRKKPARSSAAKGTKRAASGARRR